MNEIEFAEFDRKLKEEIRKSAEEIAVNKHLADEFLRIKEKLGEENREDLYRLVNRLYHSGRLEVVDMLMNSDFMKLVLPLIK